MLWKANEIFCVSEALLKPISSYVQMESMTGIRRNWYGSCSALLVKLEFFVVFCVCFFLLLFVFLLLIPRSEVSRREVSFRISALQRA